MKKNFVQINRQIGTKVRKPSERESLPKPTTIPDKIKNIEKKLEKLEDMDLQSRILEEMKLIKEQLREIKYNMSPSKAGRKVDTFEGDVEESTVKATKSPSKSKEEFEDINRSEVKRPVKSEQRGKRVTTVEKQIIQPGALQSYLKDYRINENSKPAPYYSGYIKKNSSPIFIKYSIKSLERQAEVYRKLWKEIVKARWVCVNRVYENRQADINFLILDKNVATAEELQVQRVLSDIIKILEFIHNCGYLYRNISPEHFMLSPDNKLVVLDFKNTKRYVDVKGNHTQVCGQTYDCGDFGSTSQLKLSSEGRKDDLESLGYMALHMLVGELPWLGMGREQMMKCRNGLTLQQLYKQIPQWLQYMKYVHKLNRIQKPDYNYLIDLVAPKG